MKNKRPGGKLATRPLHFIWIADCSGSMSVDGKIQALNTAIREAIPHLQSVADDNPNADVLVRAIKFSNGAQWHISRPTPIADFKWLDLTCDGLTLSDTFVLVGRYFGVQDLSWTLRIGMVSENVLTQ